MSKQRNLRKSKLSFADEEEEEDFDNAGMAVPPASVKAAQQQKLKEKKTEKKMSLLSFDNGDGEEDAPAVAFKRKGGKGRSGLRIPPASGGIPQSRAATYTQVATAGEYTAERLKELQKATLKAPRTSQASNGAAAQMPLPPPLFPRGAAPVAVTPDGVEDEDLELEDGSAPGGIPDSAAIKAAKAQRERLRAAHAAPDYIPLADGSSRPDRSARHIPAAGEDREKDSDGDAELEETIRLKFGPRSTVAAAGRNVDMLQNAEDEEEAAWAEEQIRKGVRRGAGLGQAAPKEKSKASGGMGFLPPSQSAAVAAAADEVFEALKAAVQRAKLSKQQAEKNLVKTERSLRDCIAGITRMEEELKASGDKYVYIQQLRAYISDVCSMLAEKSPLVEELQEELQRAREERAIAYARRCEDQEYEEKAPAEAAVTVALAALTRGEPLTAAESAASAAEVAAEKELSAGSHIAVELDEFGRDENVHRRAKVAERVARRAAQRAAMEAAERAAPGDITTSESEDEVENYNRRRIEVLEGAKAAFKDAADDFGSLAAIKSRLEGWKQKYPGQYNDAYMAESVPALFAPFVRLELLSWAPLDQQYDPKSAENGRSNTSGGYQGFDTLEWHRLLFDYGMPTDGSAPHAHDSDVDLVPRLVKALVVPLALASINRVWNPFSTRQSIAVAGMVGEIMVYMDPKNEALVGLVNATFKRLEAAIEGMVVPAWPPAALAATKRGEIYVLRAFGRALRLLKSVCAFQEVLPAAQLQNLAIEQLAAKQVLPFVRAAAADPRILGQRAERLLDALPEKWIRSGLPRGLEGLGDVLQAAVRALEPAAGKDETRAAKAPAALALAKALGKMGQSADAHRLKLLFGVS